MLVNANRPTFLLCIHMAYLIANAVSRDSVQNNEPTNVNQQETRISIKIRPQINDWLQFQYYCSSCSRSCCEPCSTFSAATPRLYLTEIPKRLTTWNVLAITVKVLWIYFCLIFIQLTRRRRERRAKITRRIIMAHFNFLVAYALRLLYIERDSVFANVFISIRSARFTWLLWRRSRRE